MGIQVTFTKSPKKLTKKFKESRTLALEKVAKDWFDKSLPKKFTPQAYSLYNLEQRSKKYDIRKQKKYGNINPLEWTGATKKTILSFYPGAKITPSQMKIVFKNIPKYIYYSNKKRQASEEDKIIYETPNSFDAQQKLQEIGVYYSLKYINRVKAGLARPKAGALPPMTREIIATNYKEREQMAKDINKYMKTHLNTKDKDKLIKP